MPVQSTLAHLNGEDGQEEEETDDDLPDNGLRVLGFVDRAESIQLYQANNLHPVHLGDQLNVRYKVLHKLGNGGFATIWLCRDTETRNGSPRYVAVKILAAHASTSELGCPEFNVNIIAKLSRQEHHDLFAFPLAKFNFWGPNGHHLAIVYPVFGPQTSKLVQISKARVASSVLRAFCQQATQAMAILHAHGICHGDFKPSNILARIGGLDNLSERQVMNIFGRPVMEPVVVSRSHEAHQQKTAPQYLVLETFWPALRTAPKQKLEIDGRITVIDFGESFKISTTETPVVGTPAQYCPPEYILDEKAGLNTDVWALGCTLFEIRAGAALFGIPVDEDDEQLAEIANILGPFPEPWWSGTWENRRQFFKDKAEPDGRAVRVEAFGTSAACRRDRSIMQRLERCLYTELHRVPDQKRASLREELELFTDLLLQLLKYDPAARISAAQALKHPWFKVQMDY